MDASDTQADLYDPTFFRALHEGTHRSACAVVPTLIQLFAPKSVVDVGGGTGLWAAAFRAQGMTDVLAIDGPWVPADARAVPPEAFLTHNLAQPLVLDRSFDLALCLEAAEHLPAQAAQTLVESLTRLAPIVIFSAAVPGQGGDGHINEQWPDYWAALFAEKGYSCLNELRYLLWAHPQVEVWYRQNMLCFVPDAQLEHWRGVLAAAGAAAPLGIVHPVLLACIADDRAAQRARADRLLTRADALDRELKTTRAVLEGDVKTAQNALAAIENHKVWRAYQRIYPLVSALKRLFARTPSPSTGSPHGQSD